MQLVVERRLIHNLSNVAVLIVLLMSLELMFLQIVVHLRVHLNFFQIALSSLSSVDLLQKDCLVSTKTASTYILSQCELHLCVGSVPDIRTSACFSCIVRLNGLHLVIHVCLLLVQIGVSLVDCGLGNAAWPSLFVIV